MRSLEDVLRAKSMQGSQPMGGFQGSIPLGMPGQAVGQIPQGQMTQTQFNPFNLQNAENTRR